MAVDKPMSCRAKETGLVSVAECLWFEAEAAPMERHNVQKHVLGLHDKAVDGHYLLSHLDSRLVQVLLGYKVVMSLRIW